MKHYGKYVKRYLPAFILGPIFMIVEVIGEVMLPKLMSLIINYGCGQAEGVEAKGTGYISQEPAEDSLPACTDCSHRWQRISSISQITEASSGHIRKFSP